MKKIYNYLIGALVATGMLCSCSNFDDLNTNPDSPTTVTPEMLATKLILGTTKPSTSKAFSIVIFDEAIGMGRRFGGLPV